MLLDYIGKAVDFVPGYRPDTARQKMSSGVYHTVEDRFLELIEGQKVLVDCSHDLPTEKPVWYDEDKFQRGRMLFRKYYSGIFLSNVCALLVLLVSPHVYKPLIFTGKSETSWKAFHRYIATVMHVRSWYLGDIWQDGNPARKSLQQVKRYHSSAALKMNCPKTRPLVENVDISRLMVDGEHLREVIRHDLKGVEDCPFADLIAAYSAAEVYSAAPFVNQYEMAMTQFAFFGLALVHHDKFGMPSPDERELQGLVHFWRCIGFMLGIEDRFNFCHNEDDMPFTRQLTSFTLNKIMKPSLKNFSPESVHMGTAIGNGMKFYLPGYSFEGLIMYLLWVLDLSTPNFLAQLNLATKIHCTTLKFIYCYCSWVPGVIAFFNGVLTLALTLVVRPPAWWPRSISPPCISGMSQYWLD